MLIVGTAQLSGPYGALQQSVEGAGDSPTEYLLVAAELGFDTIDTAPVYAGAEDAIRASGTRLAIHTKIKAGSKPEQSLRSSLEKLGRPDVDVLYFHDPDVALVDNGAALGEARHLVESELVGGLGTSVYSPDALVASLAHPAIDVVQLPVNPLQREIVEHAGADHGKRIFGRSLLAQGLLACRPDRLPAATVHLAPAITRFQNVCRELDRAPVEVALLWGRDHPMLDGIIIGAASITQLREIGSILTGPGLDTAERQLIDELPCPNTISMDPRTWT